jgi:propanol-preferring alcohol dehydrogenase
VGPEFEALFCGAVIKEPTSSDPIVVDSHFMMRAMVFEEAHKPLRLVELPKPNPSETQVQIKVLACAVCRTDLHIVDGELSNPKLPLVPGHEIVGRVEAVGTDVREFHVGDLVGVPWMGWTCGHCRYCQQSKENLCDAARFTGYTLDGGYAEFAVADERFCIPVPTEFSPVDAAPLLCAGLIGYRSLKKAGGASSLGIYGFGAAAHIVAQVALYKGQQLYAFTRPGDQESQDFARSLGARWAGGSDQQSPVKLDAALIFAPVGGLLPAALRSIRKGGRVICGGIHMSDIPSFPYEILWGEREVVSVANLTRDDGKEFMSIAPKIPIQTTVQLFDLTEANEALDRLRSGRIEGAAVLTP